MDSVKVQARISGVSEGWYGRHHRRVARLEIQGKDSPFDSGASLILDEELLRGLAIDSMVEIEIRPVGDGPAAPAPA